MRKILSILLASVVPLVSQSVTTEPVGFNKVTCLANSDTIVGVPLRVQGSITSSLVGSPTVSGDFATLTLSNGSLPALPKHYLKFNGGTRDGRWFDITANTATSVTIDLNGDNLDGLVAGNQVLIAEYWTLNSLFPPAQATTDPATTGHAIVASTSTSLRNRRTQLLIPDTLSNGVNLAAWIIFYIYNSQWYDASNNLPVSLDVVLMPDNYFTISQPAAVTTATTFRALGEIEVGQFTIGLRSLATGSQDNFIALPRPIDLRLNQLNLFESGAFISSGGTSLRNRRDQILIFDNEQALRNKAASAIFYHDGTNWLDAADNSDASARIIPASSGFVIRKAKTAVPTMSLWKNTSSYN